MNLFSIDFYSHSLGGATRVNVLLPCAAPELLAEKGPAAVYGEAVTPFRVLTLLHGLQGDETAWLRHTRAEQYAQLHHTALVLPSMGNSFSMDLRYHEYYSEYLMKELPAFLASCLPLSQRRVDNFIAGNSMGGFAALRLAFLRPERFAIAGSFSGALEPHGLIHQYGEVAAGAAEVPENLLEELACAMPQKAREQLKLYLCCGAQDELTRGATQAVKEKLVQAGCALRYEEWDGGHDWMFWDTALLKFMNMLPD